ncbi:hypothetical protein [Sporomusa aerivorans]|uniref:hypothetical protein n=1 Tax=Sporomusa aerivorans TaxID=204936 RepID=UPI00352B8A11
MATRAGAQVAAGDQHALRQQISAQAAQNISQMSAPAADPLQEFTAGLTPDELLKAPGLRSETPLNAGSARIQSVEVNGVDYQLEEEE